MTELNLPAYPFKVIKKGDKPFIFDEFRKNYVALTPEEWVRQHFLKWLTLHLGYPNGLMAVEAPLQYNTLKKRADAVVYSNTGQPLMIIECKAPGVAITQQTFEQAARYNFSFNTRFLAMTNGITHYCCEIDIENGKIRYMENFPSYKEIS